MDVVKRINLKKYFSLGLLSTALACLLAQSSNDILAILVVYLATIVNQYILTWMVLKIAERHKSDIKESGPMALKMILAFMAKMASLILGLSFGVHLMGPRVIIPLFNYIIQIFILVMSFRR